MSSVVIAGDTSGTVTLQAPAVSGSTVLTLPATSGSVITTASTDTANSLNAGLGVNQTWQAPSRAIGTTYTNTTGKPIMVSYTATCTAGASVQGLVINGVTVYASGVGVATTSCGVTLIVPNGATYVTITNTGTLTLVSWAELR